MKYILHNGYKNKAWFLWRYQVADQPEGSASAILATVVAELNKHKIGVPRSTTAKINELLAEPELQVNSC